MEVASGKRHADTEQVNILTFMYYVEADKHMVELNCKI